MPGKATGTRTFEVLISHDGLDKGERFTQEVDDLGYAQPRVDAGYLRDVTQEVTHGHGEGGGRQPV